MPEQTLFKWNKQQLERLVNLNYSERALRILEQLPIGNLNPTKLREMIKTASSTFGHPDVLPVRHLFDNKFLLEAFHGPTGSFKDVSLQLFPQMIQNLHNESSYADDSLLLVATSGDTGSATLDGFTKFSNFPVVVLYPKNGISPIQELQMISHPGNNLVIGIDSDFDSCQNLVKDIFKDENFKSILSKRFSKELTSSNSINWGRLFPQIFISFSGYLDMVKSGHISLGDEIDLAIPTGNFGNSLAAYYAKKMGLPIGKIICTSNKNNVVHDFIKTGKYDLRERQLFRTSSPSVDILVSSNLERLLYDVFENDADLVNHTYSKFEKEKFFKIAPKAIDRINEDFIGTWSTESDCVNAIKNTFSASGILIDPHTALSIHGTLKFSSKPILHLSTAHFGKFPQTILESFGLRSGSLEDAMHICKNISKVNNEHSVFNLLGLPRIHNSTLPANAELVKDSILEFVSKH